MSTEPITLDTFRFWYYVAMRRLDYAVQHHSPGTTRRWMDERRYVIVRHWYLMVLEGHETPEKAAVMMRLELSEVVA